MTTKDPAGPDGLVQGTLDLLILRTLALGRHHGHGIARAIETQSQEQLLVDHGSLYPALQRLEKQRWIRPEWGVSDLNRRARFYTITPLGRKQLREEASRWQRVTEAMARVLGPEYAPGKLK